MGSWMLDMIDHEQEMMGVQCILDHVSHDIGIMSRSMDSIIGDMERLNDPESYPRKAFRDDEKLNFDLKILHDMLVEFKSTYKKDLKL